MHSASLKYSLVLILCLMLATIPVHNLEFTIYPHASELSSACYLSPSSGSKEILKKKQTVISVSQMPQLIEDIKTKVSEHKRASDAPFVIVVAGKSCSGKSSVVSRQLYREFQGKAVAPEQDDYYIGKTAMTQYTKDHPDEPPLESFDDPRAVDLKSAGLDIQRLKRGKTINKPVYDMAESEPSKDQTELIDPSGADVIIVEGLFALDPRISQHADLVLLAETDIDSQINRRIARDGLGGRTNFTPEQIIEYMFTDVIPWEVRSIEEHRQLADYIILNEYDPEKEAPAIGTFEFQAKTRLPVDIRPDLIEERLRSVTKSQNTNIEMTYTTQTDAFFSTNSEVNGNGDVFRIRNETDKNGSTSVKYIYKGPDIGITMHCRPNLHIPFNREHADEWMNIIRAKSRHVAQITKQRTVFKFDFNGLPFQINIDFVDGLGTFIEVCAHLNIQSPNDRNEENIRSIEQQVYTMLRLLGVLDPAVIKDSYLKILLQNKDSLLSA